MKLFKTTVILTVAALFVFVGCEKNDSLTDSLNKQPISDEESKIPEDETIYLYETVVNLGEEKQTGCISIKISATTEDKLHQFIENKTFSLKSITSNPPKKENIMNQPNESSVSKQNKKESPIMIEVESVNLKENLQGFAITVSPKQSTKGSGTTFWTTYKGPIKYHYGKVKNTDTYYRYLQDVEWWTKYDWISSWKYKKRSGILWGGQETSKSYSGRRIKAEVKDWTIGGPTYNVIWYKNVP